jgi:hypothetical protein
MGTEQLTIKTAYEDLNMSPEEIADDRGLDVVTVKASLAATSSKYRKDCGTFTEAELDFTDQDLKDVNEIIVETAKHAELSDGTPDYRTRLAAATYIRDDKKGRKNIQKALGGTQFNILNFNESLAKLRETKEAILGQMGNSGQTVTNV